MPNRLQSEQSPYLLQHSHNPVDWYPWGDEAFDKARNENKPVLVSIGYSACHWCHVMERESFEDEEIAAFMNEHFVCIKVDREEHPDVDHIYMDAVSAITGSGGWPLNAFVTPDRLPFYGGTYFPPRPAYSRPSWLQVLHRMAEIWYEQPAEVTRQAEQIVTHLQQASQSILQKNTSAYTMDECAKIADDLLKRADKEKGGFGGAPKFPGTMAISYLIEHYHYTKSKPALDQALLSLDAMARGGIYDQLGGGFARYATDSNWLVPHFEKMLYDNALLISAYCDGYSITKNDQYKTVIEDTIGFVTRELKDESGGYYSAIDADSEGVEGKFYVWSLEEWKEVLQDNYILPATYFGVTEQGNWEGVNILNVKDDLGEVAARYAITVEEAKQKIVFAKEKLLEARQKRIRPCTDDKCLLSWNAMMNISLTKAGNALNDVKYIMIAEQHMKWMLEHFLVKESLYHVWKKGVAKITANLDDYSFLIQALLQLSSANGDSGYLLTASKLCEVVCKQFTDSTSGLFYFTSDFQKDIPVKKVEVYDGATPSANAVMAHNLILLGLCMENSDYIARVDTMLQSMRDNAMRYSYSFGYWAIIIQRWIKGVKTVICAGKQAADLRAEILNVYLPEVYVVTSKKEISEIPILEKRYFEDKNHIFVCSQQACSLPVSSVDDAFRLILG